MDTKDGVTVARSKFGHGSGGHAVMKVEGILPAEPRNVYRFLMLSTREGGKVNTHSFTHSLAYSFIHSLAHSLTHSFTHSLIHSLTHSLTRSFTHSLTRSFTHSLIHSLTHSLIHSFTYSLTLSLHTWTHHSLYLQLDHMFRNEYIIKEITGISVSLLPMIHVIPLLFRWTQG